MSNVIRKSRKINESRLAGNLSCDGKTRIEVGDTVDYSPGNEEGFPGVCTHVIPTNATQGDLIAWRTESGIVEFWHAGDVRVISKAKPLGPQGPQERVTGKTHRFEVGDLVQDANNPAPPGIVIAVFRHDFGQGDVVVWRHRDGTCSCWYANDVELVTRGPVPDLEKALADLKLDLRPAGDAAPEAIDFREIQREDDKRPGPSLEEMRAAVARLSLARELLQRVESLIGEPVEDLARIGWAWSDVTAASWVDAYCRAAAKSLADLESAARLAIASTANEEALAAQS